MKHLVRSTYLVSYVVSAENYCTRFTEFFKRHTEIILGDVDS